VLKKRRRENRISVCFLSFFPSLPTCLLVAVSLSISLSLSLSLSLSRWLSASASLSLSLSLLSLSHLQCLSTRRSQVHFYRETPDEEISKRGRPELWVHKSRWVDTGNHRHRLKRSEKGTLLCLSLSLSFFFVSLCHFASSLFLCLCISITISVAVSASISSVVLALLLLVGARAPNAAV
jgi:hypothetical protein